MAKKESVLQKKAAEIRALKESIENFEKVASSLSTDVAYLEQELTEAQANLRDTRIFLEAQRKKLSADVDDMHNLLHKSINSCHSSGLDEAINRIWR